MSATLKISGLAILAGFILATPLHAQRTALVQAEFSAVAESVPADSIVQVTAEAQGLERVAFEKLPRTGTFWVVTAGPGGGLTAPLPCPPKDSNLPVYVIADGTFLVDATAGKVALKSRRQAKVKVSEALEAEAGAVVNLISRVQEAEFNREVAAVFGWEEEPESFGSQARMMVADTNGLWLEITNYANGLAYVTLNNATNLVYEIWSKTNLLSPSWTVEQTLWPTNAEVMPFTVPTLNRSDLFIWARDWTDVDENGDGIPDWWVWQYFHTLDLNATNLDSQGNTLGYDYTNHLDPNIISFTVRLGNQHFNTTNVTGNYLVLGGVPGYAAVLVNDMNLTNAVWQPYDGTIAMSLGSTDGVYQVTCGLKGFAPEATVTWLGTDVTLNRSAPQITLTSPVNQVVAQPWLQVQGYSSKPLARVTYDLNGQTNQAGLITSSFLDTNLLAYTTNFFQCYDLWLEAGTNVITLHTTDPAGNGTVSNFIVVLDYSMATNPSVQLTWPQDKLELCGDNFTVRGWTEDAAAIVSAVITDDNGHTNQANGLVERDGKLWVENLPLNAGTNFVTLLVTNAAGLSNTTNFTVVKSGMALALTTIDGSLWLPTVNVSGTISDSTAPVWVNGVQGTNHGDSTWSARQVPVSTAGVGSFDVNAFPSGAANPSMSHNAVKPDEVVLDSALWSNGDYLESGTVFNEGTRRKLQGQFTFGKGGTIREVFEVLDTNQMAIETTVTDSVLSPDGTAIIWQHLANSLGFDSTNGGGAYAIAKEIGALHWRHPGPGLPMSWDKKSEVELLFKLGGFAPAGLANLVEAGVGNGAEYLTTAPGSRGIEVTNFIVQGLGIPLNTEGKAFGIAPAGSALNINLNAQLPDHVFDDSAGIVTITSLIVVSNAVAVGGTNNWAAVKTNDYVYVRAMLSTADTNAAAHIVWSVGDPVPGDLFQRKISKAASDKITVTATLGSSSKTIILWIVWATVTVKSTGNKTPYLSTSDAGNEATFPSYAGGDELGAENQLNSITNTIYFGFKVEIKGKLTPAGVHQIIPDGWNFYQTMTFIEYKNDTNTIYASGVNIPDSTFNSYGSDLEDKTPDFNDNIFALDGPGFQGAFNKIKINYNFTTYVRWGGQIASDPCLWWVRVKAENSGTNYNVIEDNGGTGTTNIDGSY